ncbi:arylsulfatase [Maribacter algicola]|uniref:Arylsulfatase n=1 Tax=Meishania litoralis TaxID=3434685 RepID=A0ACC7LLT5_9FLAO
MKKRIQNKKNTRNIVLTFFALVYVLAVFAQQVERPNIIIIITDDQGYGDLGITGNPHIKTPNIDAFAKAGVRFNNFHVSPVCAPTRSSLMTGRYSLRTGIRDTYNGGAIMASTEVTIAELLKQADYRTGIFGKWHLGDSYPSRPNDQGFDESVIHLSGGMGQVGDFTTWFKGDSSYFDPVLWHNGKQEPYQGYCSDIFANEAMKFITENKNAPFFCYLSFNAPHTPLQVPEKYYNMYKGIDPAIGFDDGRPFVEMSEKNKEDARKVYAMVSNIDDNVGKLLDKLKELRIADNTLVIFMTDNGPQQMRYVAGMRGRKGSVYRGGTRVPFFLQYPKLIKGKRDIEPLTAHIDILPTLAEICKIKMPLDRKIDGRSLVPLLIGKNETWSERPFFSYWTRHYPEKYYNISLQKGNYKLVGHTNYNAKPEDFELFDVHKDPYEQQNIVAENVNIASSLMAEMETHYKELTTSKNLIDPPRIHIGTEHENPVFLNRNDAGGERGIWAQEEIYGKWAVQIDQGHYNIKFKFIEPLAEKGKMFLETGTTINQFENDRTGIDFLEMKNVSLASMTCDLVPFYVSDSKRIFPFWVEMERISD